MAEKRDQIPIEQLIRKVKVIDLSHIEDVILPEHLRITGFLEAILFC